MDATLSTYTLSADGSWFMRVMAYFKFDHGIVQDCELPHRKAMHAAYHHKTRHRNRRIRSKR